MDSDNSLPQPVRNYAKKVMALLNKTDSVQRGPPRRRLEIQVPLRTAQANLSKKVKWTTFQKAPSSFPVVNTHNSFQSQKSSIPTNLKGPRQSLAVPNTRAQRMKHSEKNTTATLEVSEQNNKSKQTGIPVPKRGSQKNSIRKSYIAANKKVSLNRYTLLASQNRSHSSQPSKVSKKELEADISGVMLLEEDARSESGAGDCSNKVSFRIPLDPILQMSDRSREPCSFNDAFNSLQKEYLAQLTEFHAGWMEKFWLLYKRKAESTARNVSKTRENMELASRRKSARLNQNKCDTVFVHSIPRDTPSRITNTAQKQMNYLECLCVDSFMCEN